MKAYEEADELDRCVMCGTPLLETEGIRRQFGGFDALFCSRNCLGLYYQREQAV